MTSHPLSTPSQGPINPLSRPTSTIIRSSLVIPTFPQVLSELIHNSLDAGATRIDCWVDFTPGSDSIRVEDDGVGVSEEGLRRIGKRYESSKSRGRGRPVLGSFGAYGFRGEALSSIAALGLVDITSKVKGEEGQSTLTKVIKDSKTIYFGPSLRAMDQPHGATVTVKDLFHNIPVRRNTLTATSTTSNLAACKRLVETLALIHPAVKWSLQEDHPAGVITGGPKMVLRLNGAKTNVEVFRQVYGSAAVERVQNVRVSSGSRRVDGFISLEGVVTKSHQHLYVNQYSVDKGELQHAISTRFAASKFSAMTSNALEDLDSSINKRRSPRRLERHPIYVLDITLPPSDVDLLYNSRKSVMSYKDLDSVKGLLLAVIDEFLRRHGYASPPPPLLRTPSVISPPSSVENSSITNPTRTRRESRTPLPPTDLSKRTSIRQSVQSRLSLQVITPQKRAKMPIHAMTQPPSSEPPSKRQRVAESPPSLAQAAASPGDEEEVQDDWLPDILAEHRTRSLFHTPRVLPQRDSAEDTDGPSTNMSVQEEVDMSDECNANHPEMVHLPRKANFATEVTFSSSSLKEAFVLGQVDKKYIACVLRTETQSTASSRAVLTMIDQHAADERTAVERILQNLCEGFKRDRLDKTELAKVNPRVILSREEVETIREPGIMDIFHRWGFDLKVPETPALGETYVQIDVMAVPTALAGRLGRKDAVEMTRLLKLYLPVLDDSLQELKYLLNEDDKDADGADSVDWRRFLRWMPKEMLELANSKACRGAIMFGDRLDQEQCERLAAKLSSARLPFMCAHGRPSIAPLVVLPAKKSPGRRSINWAAWKNRNGP